MSNTKIYPKGISYFAPRQGAPEFVKGDIILNMDELITWMKSNEQLSTTHEKYGKQFKLQVTDKGLSVNTWKPTESKPERKTAADNIPKGVQNKEVPDVEDFSLPF